MRRRPRPSWRRRWDFDGAVCPPGPIPDAVHPEQFAVFAGVLPEDKYKLVKAFQNGGHTIGMCGDGANDAPALRQAQIGIAVSTATDVAKSAAGMVLTEPGLAGIVAAVKEGRVTFQRILSYTLNSITKKIVQVLFLAIGLVMTGHAILTPLLMVLIMITGDFLGMSLTTDNVRPSPTAECLADRQPDGRRRRHGAGRAGLLYRRPRFRRLPHGVRHRRAAGRSPLSSSCSATRRRPIPIASAGICGRRVRAIWLVVSSVADHSDRLDLGHRRNRHDAVAGLLIVAATLAAAAVFAVVSGFGEGSGFSPSWDHVERYALPKQFLAR